MGCPVQLDPECIVKQGYLTKSPPMSEATVIPKRWRLRWFVLYDSHARSDVDPSTEREVYMLYYKNDEKVMNGTPKGKISLTGVDVYRHRGKLHGFSHVINVQTDQRLYHLCASQIFVYNDWLQRIREHHVPYTITPSCVSNTFSNGHNDAGRCRCVSNNSSEPSSRSFSVSSTFSTGSDVSYASSSAYSDSDDIKDHTDEVDFRCHTNITKHGLCNMTCNQTPSRNSMVAQYRNADSFDGDQSLHVTQSDVVNSSSTEIKSCGAVDSEDEGIGRTDSESSVTSLETLASLMNLDISNMDRGRQLSNFVGPKLSVRPKVSPTNISRTRSVEDISSSFSERTVEIQI